MELLVYYENLMIHIPVEKKRLPKAEKEVTSHVLYYLPPWCYTLLLYALNAS
jgi:hypothetical protein